MIKYFTIEDLLKHYLQKKFHILEFFAKTFDELTTKEFIQILYLIFDYPHKHYTFKYFEV